jgi:hypothetical protein
MKLRHRIDPWLAFAVTLYVANMIGWLVYAILHIWRGA